MCRISKLDVDYSTVISPRVRHGFRNYLRYQMSMTCQQLVKDCARTVVRKPVPLVAGISRPLSRWLSEGVCFAARHGRPPVSRTRTSWALLYHAHCPGICTCHAKTLADAGRVVQVSVDPPLSCFGGVQCPRDPGVAVHIGLSKCAEPAPHRGGSSVRNWDSFLSPYVATVQNTIPSGWSLAGISYW
jgi:hypothetical protein